ncbi:hypothetical protein BD560DRAFT_380554, partial [Blakeslea trispora]
MICCAVLAMLSSVVKSAQCLLHLKSPLDWIHLRYLRHSASMSLGALWNTSIIRMLSSMPFSRLIEYNSCADVVNWFLLIIFICCLVE